MRLISVPDEMDRKIVDLIIEGKRPMEINRILQINRSTLLSRIHRMTKFFKCKYYSQLREKLVSIPINHEFWSYACNYDRVVRDIKSPKKYL